MKKIFVLILVVIAFNYANSQNCGGVKKEGSYKPTSLGIIIYSNDAETVWNAFRLANYSKSAGDTVSIFLLGKGVEAPDIDSKKFTVKEEMDTYVKSGGKILACSTCLSMRNAKEPKMCTVSTLSDLYNIVRNNKEVISF